MITELDHALSGDHDPVPSSQSSSRCSFRHLEKFSATVFLEIEEVASSADDGELGAHVAVNDGRFQGRASTVFALRGRRGSFSGVVGGLLGAGIEIVELRQMISEFAGGSQTQRHA